MRVCGSSLARNASTAALAAARRVWPSASLAFMLPEASSTSAMLRGS
jgi:hypothetical protein